MQFLWIQTTRLALLLFVCSRKSREYDGASQPTGALPQCTPDDGSPRQDNACRLVTV